MRPQLFLLLILMSLAEAATAAQNTDAEKLFARAVEMHQAGNIEGAIREYRAFLAMAPNRVDALSNLGAALARMGRYQEAIDQYTVALALDKENATIRFNLGLAYFKASFVQDAAEQLGAVLKKQPENRAAALLLSDCYLAMGEHKKVIDLLAPLDSGDPNDRALAYLLGTALIRDNQKEQGQLVIDRILRHGDSAEARLLMGTTQLMIRDYPGALNDLKRAAELNPDLASVHSLLGRALMQTGDRDAAMRAFQQELKRNPNDFDANLNSGLIFKEELKYQEALDYLQRALQARPREPNVRYLIAGVCIAQGKISEAQQTLEKVIADAPDFVEAHVLLATAYYRLKRKDDGDRERAIITKLNSEKQAKAPGAQEGLGPAYRGEKPPSDSASPAKIKPQ